MGRRPNNPKDHVPRLSLNNGLYRYDHGPRAPQRYQRLSRDRAEALRMWAEIEGKAVPAAANNFKTIAEQYQREVMPLKAPRTQKDNAKQLVFLLGVFGAMDINGIQPRHVQAYMVQRANSKTQANRERALLSHIFNFARKIGATAQANPCMGIDGYTETGRDVYVDDAQFKAVWDNADEPLRDAMDLAYLTGQRPADVLKLQRSDIKEGALWIRQNKTGKRLRIEIVGALAAVIERILARKYKITALNLILNEDGQPLTYYALDSRFEKARTKAKKAGHAVAFQFRDLRAKAATDVEGMAHARKLLGHASDKMTETYVRARMGEKVKPTK